MTPREELQAWLSAHMSDDSDPTEVEVAIWQAAYAAGQRAERDAILREVENRQIDRMGSSADYDKGALRALMGLASYIERLGHRKEE